MSDLGHLISQRVAATLDASFVEKEVESRIDKLVAEAVERALRSYSETGKLVEKAVEDALRVKSLDLPTYGHIVAQMLKTQIEDRVAELIAGRLSVEMEELLSLAPKEVKLSEIAKDMLDEGNHYVEHGEAITVIVDRVDGGYAHVYLDDEQVRDKYSCRHQLHIDKEGVIYSATIDNRDLRNSKQIGRSYGIGQKLRAYVACGTKIILDEDFVQRGIGDY